MGESDEYMNEKGKAGKMSGMSVMIGMRRAKQHCMEGVESSIAGEYIVIAACA